MSHSTRYLINLVGPTAVGKTAMAIGLAKHFNTVVLSSDSRQFYKEVEIGTAKPTKEELEQVPHYFINTLSVTQTYSAGDFERDALQQLDVLFQTYPIVVMVGGSGLYVKAVTEGLDARPQANEALREELHALLEQQGIVALQQRLQTLDAELYARTEVQNPQRLMRAIEIAEADQQTNTIVRERSFTTISIGLDLPRPVLYERINKRVDQMMQQGLLDEVKRMLPYADTYAMQTVGYKELFDFLNGLTDLPTAVELIKQHTRNYAKRQLTWFRKTPGIVWFSPDDMEGVITKLRNYVIA